MRILITGATGLVGSALTEAARAQGHEVLQLSRRTAPGVITWNPERQELSRETLEGLDAVVHLAGDNVGEGRWTTEKKRRIRDSRVQGTTLLSQRLAQCDRKPRVLVSASAIGFYGDRGDAPLDEESPAGKIFLSEVCQAWEDSTQPAWQAGIRVAQTRIGVVLTPRGGALAKMLTPFRLGGGGIVGSGKQYWSWIALPDVVQGLLHVVRTDTLHGAVNLVSPHPVTNAEFTRALGQALHRPTWVPMPAFAAKLLLGQMADELLLAGARVLPKKLLASQYRFALPDLPTALQELLKS